MVLESLDLPAVLVRFPVKTVPLGVGAGEGGCQMQFRQSGNTAIAPTHVLLHGIGSGSASWMRQLEAAEQSTTLHVLAWDAPGYASSSALHGVSPSASAYAVRLWQWLDTMGAKVVAAPITLVGHSLGCLVATQAAVLAASRVKSLILLAPAQGYARASEEARRKKLQDRLNHLDNLGPRGMAQKRASAMLSPNASAAHVSFVQAVMAELNPEGYRQAAHLLAHGDLLTDLAQVTCPVQVASGSADGITPMAACQAVAKSINAPFTSLGEVGHVCALEAAGAVSQLIGLLPGTR